MNGVDGVPGIACVTLMGAQKPDTETVLEISAWEEAAKPNHANVKYHSQVHFIIYYVQ